MAVSPRTWQGGHSRLGGYTVKITIDHDLDCLLRSAAESPHDRAIHLAIADRLLELDEPYAALDSAAWAVAPPPIERLDPVAVAEWDKYPFVQLRDRAIENGDRHVYYAGFLYVWPEI